MKSLLILCLSIFTVFAKHEIYDGYVVYEVYPNNVNDFSTVNGLVNELGLDLWSLGNLVEPGQIFVSGPQREPFENGLKAAGIAYKASVENIKELLEMEDEKLAAAKAEGSRNIRNSYNLTFDHIYSYDEVTEYLEDIARRYPNRVTLVNGGSSVEGRPIPYLEISTTGFQGLKPVIMLQALLHAREWVTLPPALYAIHKLVVDVTESDILNHFDWLIMPVANPDGYEWTRTNARFWRKNRRRGLVVGDICMGVDLNRNFNINWGTASSNNACTDTFHGTGAFSEPETHAVMTALQRHGYRISMYADLHSFGSMILFGWGNGTLVPNALSLNLAGVRMAQAIDRVKWTTKPNYVVGNIVAVLRYTASGGSSDYAQVIGIPNSFTYELPGFLGQSGLNGFLVDPAFIRQAAVETWEGIVAGARHIAGFA